MVANLGNFPIPSRELNEILYDYISKDIKPDFSISLEEGDEKKGKKGFVRICCLKCCGIIKNPDFKSSGTQRPWKKHMYVIHLDYSKKMQQIVNEATYYEIEFEEKGKRKIDKGHYDFTQLSSREQFIVGNLIFEDQRAEIPEFFYGCVKGECNKP